MKGTYQIFHTHPDGRKVKIFLNWLSDKEFEWKKDHSVIRDPMTRRVLFRVKETSKDFLNLGTNTKEIEDGNKK